MALLKAMRGPLVVVSLFLLTLYLPFASTVYTPQWYTFHCSWDADCRFVEHFEPRVAAAELAAHFRHQGALGAAWPAEERTALAEVRAALDGLFLVAILAFILLLALFSRERIATAARVNLVAVPVVVVVTGISFDTFWVNGVLPMMASGLPLSAHEGSVAALLISGDTFRYALWFSGLVAFLINLALVWQVKPPRRSIFR